LTLFFDFDKLGAGVIRTQASRKGCLWWCATLRSQQILV